MYGYRRRWWRFPKAAAGAVSRRPLRWPAQTSTSVPTGLDVALTRGRNRLCACRGRCHPEAVLAAIDAGKEIARANKKCVMAGEVVMEAANRRGVAVLRGSEHNAIIKPARVRPE